jgi:hypothetical protein
MQSNLHNNLGKFGFVEERRKRFIHSLVLLVDVIPEVNDAIPVDPAGPIAEVN